MESGVAQVRLLIVADDRTLMSTLVSFANAIGIQAVAKAENGDKALHHIRGAKPPIDLVICDGEMPSFSSLDLLKSLRAAKLPVAFLMLTGRTDLGAAVLAKRHGANDCLAKPFNQHQLNDKISAILQAIRARQPAA